MNPAVALSEQILHHAIIMEASDIHFSPSAEKATIYFRIQGKRQFFKSIPASTYQLLLTYFKFNSSMDIGELRRPQNGTIKFYLESLVYSLRLSTLPVKGTESLAIRILPQEETLPIDQLFLFPKQLKHMMRWITKRSGLILITGPTGSGKTTTLYAILSSILKDKPFQAITLEDPIEKELEDILQVQLNEKAGITYQSGFKAALRHDPDIIMVGEIRDAGTAHFALEASLSGHLVLSTIHATHGLGTIFRLKEFGLTTADLIQSLIAIASIQLIPISTIKHANRLGAILELLDGTLLEKHIKGKEFNRLTGYQTFDHLRRKALAYGYISETYYQQTQENNDT
ncbi:competence type IV pilus ATPase ComGA [Virgibacillus sp. M23]|uniref:competence type IV pilus ATPase ComGA n=1 Tax=Virgibacillus sp. M23 TaxID=3079030 RepID=UPI002A9114DB|nr:competence type IV pilus ATPase ComGA [Virgibacillus sp. M23]MDY7046117.1 competence type IV pilus ATPase ComGA [Virgibacillus sp. M23]